MNKIIMKMKKFWLAIVLSLPYSLPAVAYDLSDLKKLEELEKLEKLKQLQRLQQLEHEAKALELAYIPSYYFRLYGGQSSCIPGGTDIPASVSTSDRRILSGLSDLANQYTNSLACGLSLGMYCTRSLRLELALNYMQDMIFGCDVDINTNTGWVKLKNVPLVAFIKAAANLVSISLPSSSLECKLYWDMFSGSFGSFFVSGGICMQSLFANAETLTQNKVLLPGSTVGLGAAINITQNTSLTIEVSGIYLSSSHLLDEEDIKIESWYGYNSLVGFKYNF
ncbi:hypothetical protein OTSTA716_0726 [Orientia tsutsugamushi str. TA716]|uniref:Outer membrane beta-barrel domain protein n=2 Tax=Orientia tsutsugamushi TaxID=784 RepID=A0A0F3P9J9_ORITS|nr:hypothetical protein OTSTA716_0726 [Orientia tsutsugamushi str. TA716]